jgi:hypothetical protein
MVLLKKQKIIKERRHPIKVTPLIKIVKKYFLYTYSLKK